MRIARGSLTTFAATAAASLSPGLIQAQNNPLAGDINRPILLTPGVPSDHDSMAILSIAFPPSPAYPGGTSHLIDAPMHAQLADDLELLLYNNSYGQYVVDAHPDAPSAGTNYPPSAFRIVMEKSVEYYADNTGSQPEVNRGSSIALMVDATEILKQRTPPIDLDDYSRVALFIDDPLNANGQPVFGFPIVSQKRWGSLHPANHGRVNAVWHELSHTYGQGHAQCLFSANDPSIPGLFTLPMSPELRAYGDCFDYMGGGWGGCMARFSTECFCTNEHFDFETNVHTNPLNKWQHGWLDDGSIQVVTAPPTLTMSAQTITISSIASSSGVRAVEIPRGVGSSTEASADSLLVFYRGNEDKVDDGASIMIATRESSGTPSKVVRYERGEPVVQSVPCTASAVPIQNRFEPLSAEESDLKLYQAFYDPESGALIGVIDVVPGVSVTVNVTFFGTPPVLNDHVPALNIISPDLEPGKIVSDRLIGVQFEAFDPDHEYLPGGGMWGNIAEVKIDVVVGGAYSETHTLTPPFESLPAGVAKDPHTGRLSLDVDLRAATTGAKQKGGHVKLSVVSHTGAHNSGQIGFLYDNHGPSQ